jgi:HAD superfamily hydrolase (TIGR01509 family)
VPSEAKGIPSESAQFLQEVEAYSHERGTDADTAARIVVFAESYKIRDFDRILDTRTHVPLKGRVMQNLLYALGIRHSLPSLHPVSLFSIDSRTIYVHINELGIFPNVGGKFDLRYCENVFEVETNLLGFFSRPLLLRYKAFDEIKAVLFDFNGVIVDDEQIHFKAFSKVLQDLGILFTAEDYENLCLGKCDKDGFVGIIQRYKIEQDLDFLINKKHDAYMTLIGTSNVDLFPGSRRLLRELKNRGYKVGLVTASDRQEVKVVLTYNDIENFFDVVITNDDVTESKPSPQGYLMASEKLMIPPSRCLVIEDSPVNVHNTSQIGMKTIYVTHDTDRANNADFVINSLEELLVS